MRCTNCNAVVPRGLTSCPSCGVFARPHPPARKSSALKIVAFVACVALVASVAWWWLKPPPKPQPKPQPLPVHVVHDRPGGNVSEAEAIRVLRRHLAARGAKSECIAIVSHGRKGDVYELTAVNSCDRTKLGTWRVPRGGQAPSPVLH